MRTFEDYDLALAEAAKVNRYWRDPEEFDQYEGYEYVPIEFLT